MPVEGRGTLVLCVHNQGIDGDLLRCAHGALDGVHEQQSADASAARRLANRQATEQRSRERILWKPACDLGRQRRCLDRQRTQGIETQDALRDVWLDADVDPREPPFDVLACLSLELAVQGEGTAGEAGALMCRLQRLDDEPRLSGHREVTRSWYSLIASVRAVPGSGGLVSAANSASASWPLSTMRSWACRD
jgi:hypothetical protein